MNPPFLALALATLFSSCSRPTPPPPETSANWQVSQISLDGEWYPSVALSGAADSLVDYLSRADFSTVPPKPLSLYLDRVLSEEILPQHREAYEAAINSVLARAQTAGSKRGIIVQRGSGAGGTIQYGPDAKPHLVVQTHIYDNGGIRITISNLAHEPYSWVHYTKPFRGTPKLENEQPFP